MTVHPIISALRRHKAGVVLIVLQIALTLAIVSNAIYIIGQRVDRLSRPTGAEEKDLIRIRQSWVGAPAGDDDASIQKLDAMQLTDLAALRQLPDVQEVAAADSMPLQQQVWSGNVTLTPDGKGLTTQTAFYYGDEHQRSTFGLRLVAGRDFTTADILHHTVRSTVPSPVIIVSKPIADKFFPNGDAIGKTVYLEGKRSVIVGIVERLQTPTLAAWGSSWAYNSILLPVRLDGTGASYAVRARPGREKEAMHEARKALIAINPMRVMPDTWGIQSLTQIRSKVYRADRGMAVLMSAVCVILLSVTAAGIVGLTSFWVGQRNRQIGVRRALGARRIDILHYFQLENLFIAGGGVIVGTLLALALNLWLMKHYEMNHMPLGYLVTGVLVMLVLGQLAVFVPARRASRVPPVVATRAV